jgi:hypothetical protein
MADILDLICWAVIGVFRSRASLEAEILTLRQQLNVLRRKSPKRLAFSNVDRLIFVSLYQIAPRDLVAWSLCKACLDVEAASLMPLERILLARVRSSG